MAELFEILAAPFDVWLAPVGTAPPAIDEEPGMAWDLLGANGANNYNEEGVTVTHDQTTEKFRGLRGTGYVKAFRTGETLMFGFQIHDVTLETYARVLNDVTVTDVPAAGANAGYRHMPLHRGPDVAAFAFLARSSTNGGSPYMDGGVMQFEVPKVIQGANPAPVYRKGQPAGLSVVFEALEDLEAESEEEKFGRLVAQDALAPS